MNELLWKISLWNTTVVTYLSHPKSQTIETFHASCLFYPHLMILSQTLFSYMYLASTEVLRIPSVEGFISALKELLSWKEKQTCCFLLLDEAPLLVTFHPPSCLLQHCQWVQRVYLLESIATSDLDPTESPNVYGEMFVFSFLFFVLLPK